MNTAITASTRRSSSTRVMFAEPVCRALDLGVPDLPTGGRGHKVAASSHAGHEDPRWSAVLIRWSRPRLRVAAGAPWSSTGSSSTHRRPRTAQRCPRERVPVVPFTSIPRVTTSAPTAMARPSQPGRVWATAISISITRPWTARLRSSSLADSVRASLRCFADITTSTVPGGCFGARRTDGFEESCTSTAFKIVARCSPRHHRLQILSIWRLVDRLRLSDAAWSQLGDGERLVRCASHRGPIRDSEVRTFPWGGTWR